MASIKDESHFETHEKLDPGAPLAASTRLLNSDTTPWYQKPNLRRLYMFLVPAAIGVEMTSGFDGSVLNGLQAVDRWNEYFDHPDGAILGLISSMMNIGSVASIPIVPYCNDRWGRRICIITGSLIVVGGVIIQTAAVNQAMLIVARFFLGFGIPFAIAGASQLLSELCYPKERAVISGLFHESWYAGSVLAAGVTLGTFNMDSDWSWRLPTLFQMVPSILQLSFIWFIPESPRFLIAKDRHEEARAILIKYHAEGDENSPLVLAEYQEICEAISAEKQASTQPWKELFTARNNVRRVLIAIGVGLFAQWSGNGLVSYYLAKVLETIGITSRLRQNQINLGLMCWNLCTGIAGSFVQHWVKRRTQWLTSFTGMTIVYACWTASSAVYAGDNSNQHASHAVVALIFVYYGMYNLMMPLAYVYITEVMPYLQRSKGMGIMLIFSRFGSAFNAFVNPIGLKAIEWRMYIVYTCWLAIETTYIFFVYPETFGLSLEEASAAVEGKAYRSKKVDHKLKGEDNA
ncbi:sugar transporter domain-containing protein [Sarocladium implicatum]|nr:sugar transporter domain-containing protein [Sarocladium implicatum]